MIDLNIDNSFSFLSGDLTPSVRSLVKEVLTYRNDYGAELNMLFGQLNKAKRYNNKGLYGKTLARIKFLKANEVVCWYNEQDDSFPTGHLNIVKRALEKTNSQYQVVDNRDKPTNDVILKWYNKPFTPRYYQKEMIDLGLREGRGVFVAAVGTGKSLVLGYILKELAVNSLVIVPSVGLGGQLENDFKDWFGPHMVETVTTTKVRKKKELKPVRICTVQTLASLQKSGEIHDLVHDVRALFVDEIHHAGSASYTNLLKDLGHVYYRFGFTGTFLRNDGKSLDMWGFLSNVLYKYPAHRAIEEGYLTPIEVLVHQMEGKRSKRYQTEYDNNYCGNPDLLEKVYSICSRAQDSQILVLVKNKDKAGAIFYDYLKTRGINCYYISGDDKKDVINGTIRAFNEKKIQVLIGSSVIGEGIDVRSTDHLIMCQGGKSEIVMVQAVGRAVRLFEGKTTAFVHDFDFKGTNYMRKHLALRSEIYKKNFECSLNVIEID